MKISRGQLQEIVRRITESDSYAGDLQDHVNYLYETGAIVDALEVEHDPHQVMLTRDVNGDEDTVGEFYSQEEFPSGVTGSAASIKTRVDEFLLELNLESNCEAAYIEVRDEFPGAGLQVINYAMLHDDDLWRKGIGTLAYQQLIHDAGEEDNVIVPHWCSHGGATTAQARWLWDKLRSGYQTTGPILIPNNLNL